MFGGTVNGLLNSFEKLSLADLANGKAVWQLIEPSQNELLARNFSAVAPIDSEEITILGGHESFTDEIFFINTRTGIFTQAINKNPLKFISPLNRRVCFSPNVVTALVLD